MIDVLTILKESGDYEPYQLSQERPDFILEIANQQAEEIEAEISGLEIEAKQLAEEIENLTGVVDPKGVH